MSRTLNVAAIQMEVTPAPTAERLARAERLVALICEEGRTATQAVRVQPVV